MQKIAPISRSKKEDLLRLRIDSDLKERLEQWCVENDFSMSRLMRVVIRMHLENPSLVFKELEKKQKGGSQ